MRVIPLKEVARRAGKTESAIRRLRLAGRMPAAEPEKVGQTWVFDERKIERWLKTRAGPGRPVERRRR